MTNRLLIASLALAVTTLVPKVWAQTCQDGCFYSNTYQGDNALLNFGAGGNNTAFGSYALTINTFIDNTAIGAYALQANTTGQSNTALGSSALYLNTGGSYGTAIGYQA